MRTSHYNAKRGEWDASGKVEEKGSLARIDMMKRNAETAMDEAMLAKSKKGMINATVKGMPQAAMKVGKAMMTPLGTLGKVMKGKWISTSDGKMKKK